MEELQKAKIRKNNIKLYPIYQMIGYDLMFYFSISLLFYVQVKGLTNSDVVMLDSYYAFFSIIGYIISSMLVVKIGQKNTMTLGNIFNILGISIIIFGNTYTHFIIANFIIATGFALKGVSETAFLSRTVPGTGKEKSNIFTKIQEKGYSKFSYFSALTMFLSGFLYDINPYIPLLCCLICLVLTAIISSNFTDISDIEESKEKKSSKDLTEVFRELKDGFKFVIRSKRLRALLLMVNVLWGILCLMITYRPVLLEDIGCSVGFIGVVSAIVEIAKGFYAVRANKFHKKHRNKTLTIIGLAITISIIISGVIALLPIPFIIQTIIVVLAFVIIYAIKGIEQVIYKKYYNNFANEKIMTKIYAVDGIWAGFFRMIIAYIGAVILDFMNIRYAMIVLGVILTVVILLVSKYMKTRTGLKPEQYSKKDITYK